MMTIVLASLLSVSTQSCSSYESPLTGQNVSDITMESTEGSYDVSLSNRDLSKVKALSSDTWCTPTVNGKTIHLNVKANDTYEERKAMIVLTDSEDGSSLTFNVIQKQNNAIVAFSSEYMIEGDGGVYPIHFNTNVDFSVEIPSDCDWLKEGRGPVQTRGLQLAEIFITVSPNTGTEPRRVTFNIVNRELGLSTPITIHQLFKGQPYPY